MSIFQFIFLKTTPKVYLAFGLFYLFGCTKPISDIDFPPTTPRLVLSCFFGDTDTIYATLTRTASLADSQSLMFVNKANMQLTTPTGNIILHNDSSGIYKGYVPQWMINEPYTINASFSDYLPISASNFVPPPLSVKKITVDTQVTAYRRINTRVVDLVFEQASIQKPQYCLIRCNIKRYFLDPALPDTISWINSEDISQFGLFKVPADGSVKMYINYPQDVIYKEIGHWDWIEYPISPNRFRLALKIYSLSPETYMFYEKYRKYRDTRVMYSVFDIKQPTALYSNVQNGAGIFGGCSVTYDTISSF